MNQRPERAPISATDDLGQFIANTFLPMLCPMGEENYDFQPTCLPQEQPSYLREEQLFNTLKRLVKVKSPHDMFFVVRALVYGGLNWENIPDLGIQGIWLTGGEAREHDKRVRWLISNDPRNLLNNLLEPQHVDNSIHACYQRTLVSHFLLFRFKNLLLSDECPYRSEFPDAMIDSLLEVTRALLGFSMNSRISETQRLATSFMVHEIINLPEVRA